MKSPLRALSFFHQISGTELAAAWILSFTLSILTTSAAIPFITHGSQYYPDFVAGLLAFDDYFKSGEEHIFLVQLALFTLFLPIIGVLIYKAARVLGLDKLRRWKCDVGSVGALFLGLVAVALGQSFMVGHFDGSLFALPVLLCAAAIVMRGAGYTGLEACILAIVPPVLFGFAVLGVIQALTLFARKPLCDLDTATRYVEWAAAAGMIFTVLFRKYPRILRITNLAVQLFVPLLILRFAQAQFTLGDTVQSINANSVGLMLLTVLTALCMAISFWRLIQSLRSVESVTSVHILTITFPTLFALSFFMGFTHPPPSFLAADDFHSGEMLLPWQQIVELGQKPYAEFVSIQGFYAVAIGYLNHLVYDGTVGTFAMASTLVSGIFGGFSILAAAWCLGPYTAFLLVPLANPIVDRFYVVYAVFFLLANARLLQHPRRWFLLAAVMLWGATMWTPSTAIPLAAAVLPFSILALLNIWRTDRAGFTRECATIAATSAGLLALLAFASPLYGAIQFILENGYTNTVAHATKIFYDKLPNPSFPAYFSKPFDNRLCWEFIRIGGWITAVCILLGFSAYLVRLPSSSERSRSLAVALGGVLFALFLFPYSMGRIDAPQYLSRPGAASMTMLGFFLPVALLGSPERLRRGVLPLLVVGFLVGIPISLKDLRFSTIVSRVITRASVPSDYVWVDGAAAGMPKLGHLFMPRTRLAEIQQTREALLSLVGSDESYFDLTNRSLYYLLLDRKMLSPYPSLQAVNWMIESRVTARLEKERPAVVWVNPMIQFDRTPASLRSYRIYRWLLDSGYRYASRGNFEFLLRPDRFAELFPGRADRSADLKGLVHVFALERLDGVPAAWGKSFSSLARYVDAEPLNVTQRAGVGVKQLSDGWFQIEKADNSIDLELNQTIPGRKYDFLLVQMDKQQPKKRKRTQARLAWSAQGENDPGHMPSFTFYLKPGVLIVPVGSNPHWRLGNIESLQLSLLNDAPGSRWRVIGLQGLTLKTAR